MRFDPFASAASAFVPMSGASVSPEGGLTRQALTAPARLAAWLSGGGIGGPRWGNITKVLGAFTIVLAVCVALVAVMRTQALLDMDGAEARHHRSIKSFVSDVRIAADVLRFERDECFNGPADSRTACLREASRTGRTAVAAARDRYSLNQNLTLHDPAKLPARGQ